MRHLIQEVESSFLTSFAYTELKLNLFEIKNLVRICNFGRLLPAKIQQFKLTKMVKRIIRKLESFMLIMKGIGKVSFSQYGEDLIIVSIIDRFNIKNISYLDIGANQPIKLNNTYCLYLRGYSGVLVEPNVYLCNQLKSVRPNDKILNIGISDNNVEEADYYTFDDGLYNTFSKETAVSTEKEGMQIKKIIKIALKDINEIISENFEQSPTIISLDVEGMDERILHKLDFEKYQPLLICVETVNFSIKSALIKTESLLDFMKSKGYFIYADTHINTIFCSEKLFGKFFN